MSDNSGVKHDSGKPEPALIPAEAIIGAAKGLSYGKNKYGADNFKGGLEHRRLYNSLMRHILAMLSNEDTDPESGIEHIDLVLANAAMLKWMIVHRPDLDDRWKPSQR